MNDKYEHSLMDVCMRLHLNRQGTGDGMPDEERDALIEWLRNRLNPAHWYSSNGDSRVDDRFYELALAILEREEERP